MLAYKVKPIKITLPIINTFKTYQKAWLRPDILAGVAVASVAVPQAMAYAGLAGAPLITGLYAALFAMIAYALFTTSRTVIVGPDAAVAALTGAAIIPLAGGDPILATALVAMLSILIGVACLIGVVGRLSFAAEFLSRPILLGYMAGLALSVISSQAPQLFGVAHAASTNFVAVVTLLATNASHFSLPIMVLSAALIGIGLLVQKYLKHVPVSLVVLVIALAASIIFDFAHDGIPVVGTIPTGLPLPHIPAVQWEHIQALFIPAVAIMFISYANTAATARSFAAKDFEHVDKTQEYAGLGIANMASGIFGGIPVAASGARTAVNHASKAKTQLSQLFGALTIVLVLVLLAPLLQFLPVCALAVIIILAVTRLFNYQELRSIWHAWHSEAILAIVTVVGVVLLGIMQGLLLAVFLAVANLIRRSAVPNDAILGVAADNSIRDMSRPPKTHTVPGIIMYRFDAQLYFGNASHFRERVLQLIDESETPVYWFLWDAETVTSVDSSAGQMLFGLIHELRARHIVFAVARMKGPVRHTIGRSNRLSRLFKKLPHYTSIGLALKDFEIVHGHTTVVDEYHHSHEKSTIHTIVKKDDDEWE